MLGRIKLTLNASRNDPRSQVFFYVRVRVILDFTSDPSTKEKLDGLIAKPWVLYAALRLLEKDLERKLLCERNFIEFANNVLIRET